MKKIGDLIIQNPKSKIKIRDVEKGKFIFFRSGKNTLFHNKKIIDGENIFLSTGGTANVHYFSGDAAYSTDVFCITTDPSVCNTRYLYYKILSKIEVINDEMFKGATIKHLQKDDFKNIEFNIQPLNEQKRIVEKLDTCMEQIDKAIQNVEQNIQNAEQLFKSQLNEIFSQRGDGWNKMSLGELGKVSMCKRILKKQTSQTGDIPFYKIGTFGKKPNAFINNEIFQEYKQKYSFPNKGEILISASGTIGRRVVYDGEPAYFQDSNIVWIQNNEELILNAYLYNFFGVCDWNPSKGATISRLYNDDLRRIQISFPSIVEQKKLVKAMNDLESQTQTLKLNYKQELGTLNELKQSILEKAFNGEL